MKVIVLGDYVDVHVLSGNRYEPGQEFGSHMDASAHNSSHVFKRRGERSDDYYGDRIIAEKGMWTTFNVPCINRFVSVSCASVYLNHI